MYVNAKVSNTNASRKFIINTVFDNVHTANSMETLIGVTENSDIVQFLKFHPLLGTS